MRTTIKFAIVVISTFIMCSCVSKEEKKAIAKEYYQQQGYRVFPKATNNIPYDTNNPDNFYILFAKDGSIYLDTNFEKEGKSAQKIYPNEKGIQFKMLGVSFSGGISGTLSQTDADFGSYGLDNDIQTIREACIIFAKFSSNDKPTENKILWLTFEDGCQIFYVLGRNDALCSIPEYVGNSNSLKWEFKYDPNYIYPSGVILEEEFVLEVFSNHDQNTAFDNYDIIPYWEYPFTMEEVFSLKDLSFTGFTPKARFEKSNYPWEKIKIVYPEITEAGNYFYIPLEVSYFAGIRDCIKQAREEYQAEILREQQRVQEEQRRQQEEQYRANIINNAIYFPDMIDDFKNPIKAEKKYSAGMEIILKVYVDKIRNYSSSGYKYLITDDRLYEKARIYTNDENFAEIDYPCYVWIHARFNDRESYWDEVIYSFTDAQLLLSKKSSW